MTPQATGWRMRPREAWRPVVPALTIHWNPPGDSENICRNGVTEAGLAVWAWPGGASLQREYSEEAVSRVGGT